MKNEHLIGCAVKDCIYNDNDYCVSSSVKIDGPNADKTVETCCSTFSNSKNIVSGIMSSMDHTGSTKIKCQCANCKHNDDCKCDLDHIDVNATCDPCNCGCASETICQSFQTE